MASSGERREALKAVYEQLDDTYKRSRHWMERYFAIEPLKKQPSEYIREHCLWGFIYDPIGLRLRYDIGIDSITHAGLVLAELDKLERTRESGGVRHPLLGRGSLHASKIRGGVGMSTYPEECALAVERHETRRMRQELPCGIRWRVRQKVDIPAAASVRDLSCGRGRVATGFVEVLGVSSGSLLG